MLRRRSIGLFLVLILVIRTGRGDEHSHTVSANFVVPSIDLVAAEDGRLRSQKFILLVLIETTWISCIFLFLIFVFDVVLVLVLPLDLNCLVSFAANKLSLS